MIDWPKALVFDVDGTLAETEELHRLSFNNAFTSFGLDWEWSVEDYRQLLKVTGGKERILAYMQQIAILSGNVGIKNGPIAVPELHALKTELYTAAVRSGQIAFKNGIAELITFARTKSIRLAIATTTSRPNVDALLLANADVIPPHWFETIACGDEVERKKPYPDIYNLAVERLGLAAALCLGIEDSWNGVTAARRAGLQVVAIPSPYSSDDDLSNANMRVSSASEVVRVLQAKLS